MKVVRSLSTSPTYNLAFEEYLFSAFEDDFLLFYINDRSVILGSNQSVRNEVNLPFCAANGIQIVRRKSGGGAVYHDQGNLNFSFISTKKAERSALSADFLQPVVAWLGELGVQATIGQRKDLWLQGGYKITGTASHIRKSRELHHGTLLIDTDPVLLKQALYVQEVDAAVKATLSVRSKTINILDYPGMDKTAGYSRDTFVDALIGQAVVYYQTSVITNAVFDQEAIAALELQYRQDDWNFRK